MDTKLYTKTLTSFRDKIVLDNFAKRLKKLFAENPKLLQKDLAKYANVGTNIVSNWVNGKKQPTLTNFHAILEFFIEKGIEPIQVFFPSMFGYEVEELNRNHNIIMDEIKSIYQAELFKGSIETYKELESDLDYLQRQYDKLKKQYITLEEEFDNYKKSYGDN